MDGIRVIRAGAIESALADSPRQYLMGDLKRPQELGHIRSTSCEVGIVEYPEATADTPHFHPNVEENQYVLSGRVLVMNLRTKAVVELLPGDFYGVPQDVPHVQKAAAGTRIYFFKVPSMDDKTAVEVDADVRAWLADLDF
jgi:quercetin dioxygenase-like cupin family protein